MQNPIIGISGIRGIINDTFNADSVMNFAQAFGTLMPVKSKIAVARDTRITGEMLKMALVSGLMSTGCDVIDLEAVPTPTLQHYVNKKNIAGGIIITASHNPIEWNALKFYKKYGFLINLNEINKLKLIYTDKKFRKSTYKNIGNYKKDYSACIMHIESVIKNLPNLKKIQARRFRVALDSCNGAGYKITPQLLDFLNCDVNEINTSPDGYFPRKPEPSPLNLKELCKVVKSKTADIGFAQDPDADRLAIVNEKAKPLIEEFTITLAVSHILKYKKGAVVTNFSTTRMIEDAAKEKHAKVIRTPVGEMNVADKMIKTRSPIGGEGNGGVIFPPVNYGRDSLAGIGLILDLMADEEQPISKLAAKFDKYFMVKDKIKYSNIKIEDIYKKIINKYPNSNIDKSDGLYIKNNIHSIHLRPSNTEPVFRIIVESESKKHSLDIVKNIQNLFR